MIPIPVFIKVAKATESRPALPSWRLSYTHPPAHKRNPPHTASWPAPFFRGGFAASFRLHLPPPQILTCSQEPDHLPPPSSLLPRFLLLGITGNRPTSLSSGCNHTLSFFSLCLGFCHVSFLLLLVRGLICNDYPQPLMRPWLQNSSFPSGMNSVTLAQGRKHLLNEDTATCVCTCVCVRVLPM